MTLLSYLLEDCDLEAAIVTDTWALRILAQLMSLTFNMLLSKSVKAGGSDE